MIFAIRDDDTSFFTSPNELVEAFKEFDEIPISLSIVPVAKYNHGNIFPYGKKTIFRDYCKIDDNNELVSYIKDKISKNKFEVLMHGIHHEYKFINNEWIPEMRYLKYSEIRSQISEYRDYLQNVFEVDIDTFIAPSNIMNKDTFKVLDELGMNTMCMLSKHLDHYMSLPYLRHYMRRNINKIFNKFENHGIMNYTNHKELISYPLCDFENSWNMYLKCKENNVPYVIYTHYWEINSNKEIRDTLLKLINNMIKDGAQGKFVSECFNYYNNSKG